MSGQWDNEAFHDAWKHLQTAAKAKTISARKIEERAATLCFWRACGMNEDATGMGGQAVGAAFRPLGGE